MARILALDFGLKRTGIAVTDPLQLIASGLTTVATSDLMSFLEEYTGQERVERIVVGEPRQTDNQPSEGMKKKKRREKATLDEISATLILQSFLSSNNP